MLCIEARGPEGLDHYMMCDCVMRFCRNRKITQKGGLRNKGITFAPNRIRRLMLTGFKSPLCGRCPVLYS